MSGEWREKVGEVMRTRDRRGKGAARRKRERENQREREREEDERERERVRDPRLEDEAGSGLQRAREAGLLEGSPQQREPLRVLQRRASAHEARDKRGEDGAG